MGMRLYLFPYIPIKMLQQNIQNTLLDRKREDLINVLKEIRDKCKDINELKVKKVSEKIQGRPISKVLKR